MKYTVDFTNHFIVIERIANGETLEPKYHLHQLAGQYEGCFECHIEPDWLLVYKIYESKLILMLARLGTHSELFK